jgi:hypothetical protein
MEHRHFYVTPEVLPTPDATDTEWIQRVTMLSEMIEKLAESTFTMLLMYAPVLAGPNQPFSHLLGGMGLVCRGVAITGRQRLEKTGTAPLDLVEDQKRIIRDALAKPTCDPELREALLTILAHSLESPGRQASSDLDEWPGVILDGG